MPAAGPLGDHSRPTTRFPATVEAALRAAGWQPGRRDIKQAEIWADQLRAHVCPGGHRHAIFAAAVEAWAEFGPLSVAPVSGTGYEVAPCGIVIDPIRGVHLARTFADLGRALATEVCPLGEEPGSAAKLAIDAKGRVYAIDHTGDWYLGESFDQALTTLITGARPVRLTP
ncbi:MAG: SUKH-3 domain-containing protein [Streptomycetaceae bacterium]|nr:SUKH-3 domain-containing protein [Streptomycetaceae bacterium]